LVEDFAGARHALEAAGIAVAKERNVVVVQGQDRPGILGEVAGRMADAGVNIDLVYVAGNRLVLGVDDVEKAREVA
jgi:hypothetical protein